MDDQNQESQDWRVSVLGENAPTESPELFEYMGRFKSHADEVKSHYEAHKLNTRKTDEFRSDIERQLTPSDDWDDDAWKAFGERTRSKNPDAYQLAVPDSIKTFLPQETLDAELQAAAEEGIPARWAVKFAQRRIDAAVQQVKDLQAEAATIKANDEKALQEELAAAGKDEGEFKTLSERGQAFAVKAAGMEKEVFDQLLETYGLDTHPAFRKIFAAVGELSRDMPLEGGDNTETKSESQYEKNKRRWPNTPSLWGNPDA